MFPAHQISTGSRSRWVLPSSIVQRQLDRHRHLADIPQVHPRETTPDESDSVTESTAWSSRSVV